MEISDKTFYDTLEIMQEYLRFLERKKEEEKAKILKMRNEGNPASVRSENNPAADRPVVEFEDNR